MYTGKLLVENLDAILLIYVRDYADPKNWVCPDCMPPPVLLYAQRPDIIKVPYPMVASLGLGNRDRLSSEQSDSACRDCICSGTLKN